MFITIECKLTNKIIFNMSLLTARIFCCSWGHCGGKISYLWIAR